MKFLFVCLVLLATLFTPAAQASGAPVWQEVRGQTGPDPYSACQASTAALDALWYLKQVEFKYVIYRMYNVAYCYGTSILLGLGKPEPQMGYLNSADCIANCEPSFIPPQCLNGTPCIPLMPVQKNAGGSASNNPDDGSSPLCNGSDPINGATGNEVLQETDYRSANAQLVFRRTYNSALGIAPMPETSSVGTAWRHSYDQAVYQSSPTLLAVTRADGKSYAFHLLKGLWVSDADVMDTLVQLGRSDHPDGWQYTTQEQAVERYHADGRLISMTQSNGYAQRLTYSDGTAGAGGGYVLTGTGEPTSTVLPSGRLIRVTDSSGRSLQFGYDTSGNLVRLVDPAGAVYLYDYDSNRNLIAITWPDGAKRSYVYEDTRFPHALTGLIDQNGKRYATWAYDADGRAMSSEHANGVDKYSLAYAADSPGVPASTTITDPLGSSRIWNFTNVQSVFRNAAVSQACDTCPGNIALSLRYDGNGNIISRTDFDGRVTTYVFDETRNLETRRTEAAGTPQARTIRTSWSPDFRLPLQISETGRVIRYRYDRLGNVLSQTISDSQNGTSETRLSYTTVADRTLPNLLKTLSISSNNATETTTYSYYPNGDLHTASNAQGLVITVTKYDANGHPLSFIDPDGVVTALNYSSRGWLQSKTVGNAVTRYRHDAAGQLTQVNNPDGSIVTFAHDAAHRLTDITDGFGNRIHFTLDAMGKRTDMVYHDASGVAVSGRSTVFDTLLESDDDGYSGSGEPGAVGLPDPSAQAQQHLARQLTQILRNLRDRMCGDGDCPPCKTVSGKIVPVGTVAYRPLEIIPYDVKQHGIYGSHHNLFIANQYPYPKCDCFWAKQSRVAKPDEIQPSWIPIEPFAN
ncbi:MAG: DUF6531 domain-containing protein [Sulfuriferula sp.]